MPMTIAHPVLAAEMMKITGWNTAGTSHASTGAFSTTARARMAVGCRFICWLQHQIILAVRAQGGHLKIN